MACVWHPRYRMDLPLYTIGHSTRELADFLALLEEHDIRSLVDVRRFPGSRRHPHFGSEALARSLADAGIVYRHAPELGGRRESAPDSPNGWWRNASFRAYADYMGSPAFQDALAALLDGAHERPTVIMCAEAVPWRCHRNLISDAAAASGISVEHILDTGKTQTHVLNPAARVQPGRPPTYPAESDAQGSLGL